MRYFSIRELERLSGIKAHTIRIWEQRYDVFKPMRTRSNLRYYTVDDLKYLLNIALLIRKGYKISQLVSAGQQILENKILSITERGDREVIAVDSLLIYMYWEDVDKFEMLLDSCVQLMGIDNTMQHVILPFLEKSDILSYNSDDTNVHFTVTSVRKKIICGIESLPSAMDSSERALLFLCKGEHYDLMLLYLNYVLKAAGVRVFYLGTNISLTNFEKVVREKRPTIIFSYITAKQFNGTSYCNILKHYLPATNLYVFYPHKAPNTSGGYSNIFFRSLKQISMIRSMFLNVEQTSI